MNRPSQNATPSAIPLVVDLDLTLISTDSLWEMCFNCLRKDLRALFLLPLWAAKGPLHLKNELTKHVHLAPYNLPYRPEVLEYINTAIAERRIVVLATAAHRSIAQSVSNHLELFDYVLATDEVRNLKGSSKADAIETLLGHSDYEYLGDSKADIPIWARCSQASVVADTEKAAKKLLSLAQKDNPTKIFPTQNAKWPTLFKGLRIYQWVKNALLFLPLLLSHQFTNLQGFIQTSLAFLAFSVVASSGYLINDLLDLEADRQHPKKKHRPLASGALSIPKALSIIPLLLCGAASLCFFLPPAFAGLLLLYFITTQTYSFVLKKLAIIDVIVLAGLYTLRILAGAAASNTSASTWLLTFSLFFFTSLAFLKRRTEIAKMTDDGLRSLKRRGYDSQDAPLLTIAGIAAGYTSVLVLGLYLNSPKVLTLYANPSTIWLILPILLYWLTRVWLLGQRGQMDHDPVVFALGDRVSHYSGILCIIIILLAIME